LKKIIYVLSGLLISFILISLILYINFDKVDLDKAVNYLAANYNSRFGLIPEVAGGDVYWVYSDNYLAYLVLKYYDPSNETLTKIADNITSTLAYYSNVYNVKPVSKFNILGGSTPYFNASVAYNLTEHVKVDLNNGTGVLDPKDYADVAFLMAIHYYKIGDYKKADGLFEVGAGMFDGIGFKDLPFKEGDAKGIYQTYKLGLYYLAGQVLGKTVPDAVVKRIKSLQASNGGFLTGYYANGTIPRGVVTNIETTAIIVYAFSPQIVNTFFPRQTVSLYFDYVYAFISLLLIVTILIILLKKEKDKALI